ncbi:hypothetical protein [Agromyces humi]|uniref:hypothetical protein n=1 Tax=Agromyces humi TaxID=1766800 RepID=UPI0013586E41|nr:hypothetical protein [Agromyces humi]
MSEAKRFRAVAADGRMLYPFPGRVLEGAWGRTDWVTEGVEVRRSMGTRGELLIVPAALTEVAYRVEDTTAAVTTWVCRSENPHLPDTVPGDAWDAFAKPFGYDEDGHYNAASWYKAEIAGVQHVVKTIDLTGFEDFPANLLDPASTLDPDPSFTWAPSPAYLVFGEWFGDAVPGALVGFSERLVKMVEDRLPSHVKVWTHEHKSGLVKGSVTLQFEDRRTFPLLRTDKRRKQQFGVSTQSFSFEIPFAKTIPAKSKAAAIAEFHRTVDAIVAQIDVQKPAVCAHCSGDGVVMVAS